MSRLLAFVSPTILCAIILLVPRIALCQICPQNLIAYGCWPDGIGDFSREPTRSYSAGPWNAGEPCPIGCYDLRSGVLEAKITDYCSTVVRTEDEFWIESADGASVFAFWVDMHVTGTQVSARTGAYLGTEPDTIVDSPAVDFHRYLGLNHHAGEHFRVGTQFWVEGSPSSDASASARATIRFFGLPSSARLVSCQSYDQPVPTLLPTWGAVRAKYR